MTPHPIAFMSYVRFDDQHENGRLTQFCERLSGEVRMQTGDKFHIFQDRNDISWGQEWKQRIDGSLDSVTFLVPIITPAFFKSPACREEFERFLKREKELGRADLILPVYYVECSILSDEIKRKKDSLAATIAERQFADWRELRFEPLTSPQVGKTLAKMARQILEALERDRPVTSSNPVKRRARRTTAVASGPKSRAVRSREGSAVSAMETNRGPSRKIEPPTRVVDGFFRGDHATLTEALETAKPGDRILIRPGLYKEGVVLNKPVEIVGDGRLGEVVIEASDKDVILFKANMGRIVNLTLRQLGKGKWYGVDIAQGRLELEGCDISSESSSCVGIHGGADPRLRRNRIHNGKECGIFVYDNGQGTLEDNDIFANELSGVAIKTGGNPTIRRNRIHDGKTSGVHVFEKGQGTLEDNDIFANEYSGVEISEDGNPTIRRNRIHDGKACGVYVYQKGQGTLEDNDIFANEYAGVAVSEDSNPALRRNRIHDGKENGVVVYENGQGTLEDNEIFANAITGVAIKTGGNPTLRRNRISKNGYEAVWVSEGGAGVFEENDLRGNTRGAWDIASDCKKKVKRSGNVES